MKCKYMLLILWWYIQTTRYIFYNMTAHEHKYVVNVTVLVTYVLITKDSFVIFHLYSYVWSLLKNIAVADIDFHF